MVDLSVLNPEQREAVETLLGPVLVLAGAGTGKTRVITYRMAHLIATGVSPDQILAVTFTNKAAREMLERVSSLLERNRRAQGRSGRVARPVVCTFHSFGARLLREHIERLGYKRNFVVYAESDQLALLRRILSRLGGDRTGMDPAAVLSWLSRWRNGDASTWLRMPEEDRRLAERVRKAYEDGLRACNAVDFDDLLLLPLRLFREHPEVLASCQERYQFVMVDEYQDTNTVQLELLRLLVARHRNLCVVGDDDQSIYGWRGAELANLLHLEEHFPGLKVIRLEQNYRSTNIILRAANTLIRQNTRRRPKQLWSRKGSGQRIAVRVFADEEDEAAGIVQEIERRRLLHRIPWSAQAVLFRTNGQVRALEVALRRAGVRYRVVGGQSFFDRREIRDVVAWLKTLVNPDDDISLLRIANVPARGLGESTLQRLLALSVERGCSVYAVMREPGSDQEFSDRARACMREFLNCLEAARLELSRVSVAHGSSTWSDWSERFFESLGYFAMLRREEKDPETAQNRIRNVRDFLSGLFLGQEASGEEGRTGLERLQAALETVTLDADRFENEDAAPGDGVTLITLHSCKGLEFPHVYITGLEEGLLPHGRSLDDGTVEEERRLLYVGMTRAMETLHLSYCRARRKYGELVPCHPSRFLKELPAELLETAADQSVGPADPPSAWDWFERMRQAVG
ncbi:MAG: UvrD-helicase domain-containing protein [Verrucomicrobiota bacterium]|nr:UvrD-helicase domain-containing protein [Limisphaera sp.]MDW8381826.1 UvrD-helicase domain-containing protein [Verrucomicrobiota bacterium]